MSRRVLALVREAGARPPAVAVAAARLAQELASAAGATADLCWVEGESALAGRWQTCWRLPASSDTRCIVDAVASLLASGECGAVVVEDAPFGREVAGRLARRAGMAVAGEALGARWSDAALEVTRSIEGGRRTARLLLRPPVVVVASVEAAPNVSLRADTPPAVSVLEAITGAPALELVAEERLSPWEIDVTEADVVVAGGRGVGGRAGFDALAELAALLNGAVGATRVAVDLGWAPRSCQVGATGKTVAPRLYMACGISGASHHVLGMRHSGFIVAINPDAHAPIHQLAHVSIVAKVEDVLPAFVARLKSRAAVDGTPWRERVVV